MLDLSQYLEGDDEGAVEAVGEAEDLVALKSSLQALADAVANTNLAVVSGAQGDLAGANARVQASVAALKRFHEAFHVLDDGDADHAEDD